MMTPRPWLYLARQSFQAAYTMICGYVGRSAVDACENQDAWIRATEVPPGSLRSVPLTPG
jgi:hypothetical protein